MRGGSASVRFEARFFLGAEVNRVDLMSLVDSVEQEQ